MSNSHGYIKRRLDAPTGFFESEAAGLAWLAAANGVRVVSVLDVAARHIVVEHIAEVQPTEDAARRFGGALAVTHAAGAAAFGAPPDGYDGPLYIGNRTLPAAHETSWGRFYAATRVLPYLKVAEAVGNISEAGAQVVRQACELAAAGAFDDGEPPARIHGDLWHGNVLWAADGVVLIDPAAHGGHRETDLAMLALFGCPHLDAVLDGYNTQAPLGAGWRKRVSLHQLHPLAVHAAGYGPSYGSKLHRAAQAVVDSAP